MDIIDLLKQVFMDQVILHQMEDSLVEVEVEEIVVLLLDVVATVVLELSMDR